MGFGTGHGVRNKPVWLGGKRRQRPEEKQIGTSKSSEALSSGWATLALLLTPRDAARHTDRPKVQGLSPFMKGPEKSHGKGLGPRGGEELQQ